LVKKAGDHVEAGETIAEIEEAKYKRNLFTSSRICLQILVEEGVSVPVLTTLCLIGTQEELQVQTEQPINVTLPNTSPTVSQPTSLEANKERLGATVEVTPVARKLAKKLNVRPEHPSRAAVLVVVLLKQMYGRPSKKFRQLSKQRFA